MTNNKLWSPKRNTSLLKKFINQLSHKRKIHNYKDLHKWSVKNKEEFWNEIWNFTKIIGVKKGKAIEINKNFLKTKFFNKSKLNYAENCLSKKDLSDAIIFYSENKKSRRYSWSVLRKNVFKVSYFLKSNNVLKNDRVAAILPNIPETVISFLATSQIGAIWSSCSPDFGTHGVIERFSQINPKILVIADRYYYNGKEINVIKRLPLILKKIKSIKKILIINYPGKSHVKIKRNRKFQIFLWNHIKNFKSDKINFKKFDFNHDLAILYSSGTTGKPKCISHRSGGVLLQHLKEHQLHCDIKPKDNIFYFTTCGWMMWNWLITSLASKASIVLFDGFPMYKKNDLLLEIADKEKITLLGVSAKYIDSLKKLNFSAKSKYKLKNLKTICSTGSPLSRDGFNYIYKKIKSNVHLASISGGTDIVSCFVLGNIYSPVFEGEIQNNGLGMDVDIFNEKGKSLLNKKGELVCKNSFPSMPKKFWNDKGNLKYKNAYFNRYKNVWHHGDYAEKKKNGGYIIYGRSDTTLNPGGARLGTAEIYSVVEKFKEIKEAIVVGQNWDNDIRIILFVILNKSFRLNKSLIKKLRKMIKKDASPRHVPTKIISVTDIPRTKNGKIVELAVKSIIDGNNVKNIQALANPEVLKEFKNLEELKI